MQMTENKNKPGIPSWIIEKLIALVHSLALNEKLVTGFQGRRSHYSQVYSHRVPTRVQIIIPKLWSHRWSWLTSEGLNNKNKALNNWKRFFKEEEGLTDSPSNSQQVSGWKCHNHRFLKHKVQTGAWIWEVEHMKIPSKCCTTYFSI